MKIRCKLGLHKWESDYDRKTWKRCVECSRVFDKLRSKLCRIGIHKWKQGYIGSHACPGFTECEHCLKPKSATKKLMEMFYHDALRQRDKVNELEAKLKEYENR